MTSQNVTIKDAHDMPPVGFWQVPGCGAPFFWPAARPGQATPDVGALRPDLPVSIALNAHLIHGEEGLRLFKFAGLFLMRLLPCGLVPGKHAVARTEQHPMM